MTIQESSKAMVWGDFTSNAADYGQRPPYDHRVLSALVGVVRGRFGHVRLAEIGAGTGNLLRSFVEHDISGYAVEPNPAMRSVAHELAPLERRFEWTGGTAEKTELPDGCVNWVILGNAYPFVDTVAMFREAQRILVPGGFLTIAWNVRDFKRDPLQNSIEETVKAMVPDLKRTGSSVAEIMERMDTEGLFRDFLYTEGKHIQAFSPERFVATWKAGCDVPSQVSPVMWDQIIEKTRAMTPNSDEIQTRWLTRTWTLEATQKSTVRRQ
ncbi:class I SAM-dependent methyltransferase [Rhizobium mongolense]